MSVVRPEDENDDPTFTELDYIANLLYQAHSRKEGYAAGVRWWCHRADGREEFREQARKAYTQWAAEERIILEQQKARYP